MKEMNEWTESQVAMCLSPSFLCGETRPSTEAGMSAAASSSFMTRVVQILNGAG